MAADVVKRGAATAPWAARSWSGALALSSIVLLVTLLFAHHQEIAHAKETTAALLKMRVASEDLHRGVLHLELGNEQGSPWQPAQGLLLLLSLLVGAIFIKAFGNACHRRNHLSQSLLVLFHAAGPLLLVQLLNGIPNLGVY